MFPRLGSGVGLRPRHYGAALAGGAALPGFFEVVTENFFGAGGRPREVLLEAACRRPIALHGVSLSIGSTDPLDERYLDRLAALCDLVRPAIVSDHLCWTSHGGRHSHDLLPLVFTPAEAERIAARVREVQARLGRRILLENVSRYLSFRASTMTEWEFLASVAGQADAGILLDVNNVFVTAANTGFDPLEYFAGLPAERVGQIHLAGHTDRGRYLFDTHDAPIADPVWSLYERALERFGPVSTLIERDGKLPEWPVLLAESERAASLLARFATPRPAATTSASVAVAEPARAPEHETGGHDGPAGRRGSREIATTGALALWEAIVSADSSIAAGLVSGGALAPEERVAVYAESFRARLHDALLEDFPATDTLLGHERFHAAALDYARAHPSTSPDLGDFGAGFAAFLGDTAAADLAALEWARAQAFDAADAPALEAATLAAVPADRWPSQRFVPHPSLTLVPVRFRVDAAWRASDAGEAPSAPEPADGALRVWREGTTVYHAWMDPPETAALSTLASGAPFATAADRLALALGSGPDAAAARLFEHLRAWLADGIFASLHTP